MPALKYGGVAKVDAIQTIPNESHLFYTSYEVAADYTLGNCRIRAGYTGPFKDTEAGGCITTWEQGNLDLGFTYGINGLYFDVKAENLLNDKKKGWTRTFAGNYSSVVNTLETGRKLVVRLTYTFCFGRKKTDRSIEIDGVTNVESSVKVSR